MPIDRTPFLLTAYAVILFQLTLSFAITFKGREYPSFVEKLKSLRWAVFLAVLGIVLLLVFVPMPLPMKFIVFTLFAIIVGCMLLLLTVGFDTELVTKALAGAIGTFIVTSIVGYLLFKMGYTLAFMSMILFMLLLAVLITGIVFAFVPVSKKKYKTYLSIVFVLFAVLTVYDTNMIMDKNYYGDVVDAALDLYVNIINLFESIFQIENLSEFLGGGKK
jgi:FtsH-binding integral membrane protein